MAGGIQPPPPSSGADQMGTTITPATSAIGFDGQLDNLSQLHSPATAPSTHGDSTSPKSQNRPDTSNDVPQLPQDVLVMCFNHLHDDPDTLARLARTSKHFQELSTPMLYSHRYFEHDDALLYGELLPLALVTERTPSTTTDCGQQATGQPEGAQQISEPRTDDIAVERDRVGRKRYELQQLTKSLTIRVFVCNLSARMSDTILHDNFVARPLMRGVDTLRLVENSNRDIHRLFGHNNSYQALLFGSLLRDLVNPRHFCLEIVESSCQSLDYRNRCSCYHMLVKNLCHGWSRLEMVTVHTNHLMLKQRCFIRTPESVRLRIFVALVGGDIEHRLETDSQATIDSLARKTLGALKSKDRGRQRKKAGPIELIFEELDDEQVDTMQARMAKVVQTLSIDGMPAAEVLEKGEDGCLKLKGVTLLGGKSSSACTICGDATEERGAYRGYEELKPGSEPCHAVGEIKPAQATLIQGHDGGNSAEAEQVISTGGQAGDVAITQPDGEKQHHRTDNKNMPHDAAAEIGQAEAKQGTVSMNVSPEHKEEPMAMEAGPHLDCSTDVGAGNDVKEKDCDNDGVRNEVVSEQAELQQESSMVDMGQTNVDGTQTPAYNGGNVDYHPVSVDMQTVGKDMARGLDWLRFTPRS